MIIECPQIISTLKTLPSKKINKNTPFKLLKVKNVKYGERVFIGLANSQTYITTGKIRLQGSDKGRKPPNLRLKVTLVTGVYMEKYS